MKIGVIGLGAMGQHHARIYNELGILTDVCDTDESRFKYDACSHTDLDKMLEKGLTAVSIAVPTQYHLEVARKCFEKGCHVLVEKPLSDNVADAQEMIDLARKYNKILAVGYIERFNPAFQQLKRIVDEGYFGSLTSVNIKRVGGLPRSADNVILDLMTHDFDLLMSIFDKAPSQIFAHTRESEGIVNSAQVLLDFGDASATCEANWISPVKIREIHITGTKGCASVDLINQTITKYKSFDLASTHRQLDIQNLKGEPLKAELEAFLAEVQGGEETNLASGEEGLRTLEVTLEAVGK